MSLQLPQALLLPQVETPGAHKVSWWENRLHFIRVVMTTRSCELARKSTRLTVHDKLDQQILAILNTYNLRHWCRWRLVKVMYHLSLDFVGSPVIFFIKVEISQWTATTAAFSYIQWSCSTCIYLPQQLWKTLEYCTWLTNRWTKYK